MSVASALAGLTVVVPVGPGDDLTPALRAQLAALPASVTVRVVYAERDRELRTDFDAPPARRNPGSSRRVGTASVPTMTTGRTGKHERVAHPAATQPCAGTVDARGCWKIVHAPRGRASQQNAGARDAVGEWLWFLHADCVPTAGTLPALARFIARDEWALGYFDLGFLDDGPALMRFNALGVWLRSHWLGLPFGDQGLVLPRAVFEQLGGFDPALARGEDHDLVWRVRRAGVPLRAVGAPLLTSARRYARHGWWKTTSTHLRETWHQARRFSRRQATR